MPGVLVVDDDRTVREVVISYLRGAGLSTHEAGDGLAGVAAAAAVRPDLVVLDLMLPGIDGLEAFRRMRAADARLPVILLSAKSSESDRILGLEVGADDYVAKPFSARELVLRVQALLRRAPQVAAGGIDAGHTTNASADHPGADSPSGDTDGRAAGATPYPVEPFVDGTLVVDLRGHRASLEGAELRLTTREFDLLAHLITHPGLAFTREQLMREVWGWEFGDQSTVTVHVRRLREKLEPDPAEPQRISTVWGVGYRWDGLGASPGPGSTRAHR